MRRFLAMVPLLATSPAVAGPREDVQLWTTAAASGSLGGPWLAQGDVVLRFGGDGTQLYQRTLRGAVGHRLSGKASIYVGYAHVTNFVDGAPNRHEHRPFQQLSLDLGKRLGGSLSARTRLEERFMEGGGGLGLRLRQQLRFARPLGGDLSLILSGEGFVALNETDWGASPGLERLRSAVGLRHPIVGNLGGEIGYLNQYTVRQGGRDSMDHAFTFAASLSF